MRFTPEQVINHLYGPPPKEGAKKLSDFKKKGIPTPERLPGTTSITAEGPDGKERSFNLEEIRDTWASFFNDHNLPDLAKAIEGITPSLTPDQEALFREKAKEGFDRLILLPPPELLDAHLASLKEATEKALPGLPDQKQYSPEGTRLSDRVTPAFPDHITTLNRTQGKPYFLFLKDTPEVDEETKNRTPEDLRAYLATKGERGLTLPEYLLFQRSYTQDHVSDQNPHPDTQLITWLLDSELDQQTQHPGFVPGSDWDSGHRRVGVYAHPSDYRTPDGGARSSAIMEI